MLVTLRIFGMEISRDVPEVHRYLRVPVCARIPDRYYEDIDSTPDTIDSGYLLFEYAGERGGILMFELDSEQESAMLSALNS